MRTEQDFAELLKLFNKNKVRYCIIGAFAVAFYAKPRYTKDMDILVCPDIKNGEKIVNALNEFGFKSLGLSAKDFSEPGRVVQLGYEPVRIDIITSIKGLNFEKIWKTKEIGEYGTEKVFFIGLNELIKSKKLARRKQDEGDINILLSARTQEKARRGK